MLPESKQSNSAQAGVNRGNSPGPSFEKMKSDATESNKAAATQPAEASPEQRGFNVYTWMVLFTAVLGGIIFGLDIGATATIQMDGFRKEMGIPLLPPKDSGLSDSPETTNKITLFAVVFHITTLIGALPSGWLSDRLGRKIVITLACLLLLVGDIWQICSGLLGNLDFAYTSVLLGRAVAGFGNGFILTVMPVYAAELSPSKYRGQVITVFQLMITIGILIMAFINLGVQDTEWGWRLSIGIQILPIVVILVSSLIVLPESPRFLVKAGHEEKARRALSKLSKGNKNIEKVVDAEMQDIINEVNNEKDQESGSVFDLFRGTALPAFMCGFFIALCQNITGVNWFMNYATILFNSLGFEAFLFDTILKLLNVVATFVAIFVVERLGRKFLTVWGTVLVITAFFCIVVVIYGTGVDVASNDSSDLAQAVKLFIVIMIFFFQCVFAITWGPMGWLVPGEVFPLRLRGVGMGFAVVGNMVTNIALGDYGYQMMQASIGFDATVIVVLCLNAFIVLPVVVFFQPETKGVSLEDMSYNFMFEMGGNSDLGHGRISQFCSQNGAQSLRLLSCRSVEPFSSTNLPARVRATVKQATV